MNENVEQKDSDHEWFFEHARRYPLLTVEEEKHIDECKWNVRTELLQLFVKDTYCRHFLGQWANQLQHNAPVPEDFDNRQAYLALRREQSPLLRAKGGRKKLQSLSTMLGRSDATMQNSGTTRYSKRLQIQADALLDDLNLTAVLVVGMAEHLLKKSNCGDVANGLGHWSKSWPAPGHRRAQSVKDTHVPAIRQALKHYEVARDRLVNHNLRLVFSVAGKTHNASDTFMDRVQNGVLGLIRAAEKFESSKGFRFSTYAYNWINQAIQRGIQDQRGIVRYPRDIAEKISKVYWERIAFVQKHGREPGELELAKLLKTKPEELFRLQQITDLAIPLDSHFGNDQDGIRLDEKLGDDTVAATSFDAERTSLNRRLRRCLEILSEQEQRVIDMRWGLGTTRALTRKELSAHLQISPERIRQIEEKALDKLRQDHNVIAEYQIRQSVD